RDSKDLVQIGRKNIQYRCKEEYFTHLLPHPLLDRHPLKLVVVILPAIEALYILISAFTSRKSYALEEACTVWEGVLIDQKEESTSTDMPLGTAIHNIEITLGKGGQLVRATGAVAKLIAKEGKSATLKLPSEEVRLISKNCSATVGQVGNVGANQKSLGRAGSKRWLGKRPVVRGVVMNPVDHPHGGGEGRAPIGRKKPTTPWGYPALGRRSRKRNKYSDNLIVRRRSK
ncbi:hypothetical protein RD792_005599, partial [Penstemon davidsonii]